MSAKCQYDQQVGICQHIFTQAWCGCICMSKAERTQVHTELSLDNAPLFWCTVVGELFISELSISIEGGLPKPSLNNQLNVGLFPGGKTN